ncbi:DUF2771 family protein [Nakamurella deserti]|uniref:DUF2771 family protein n=1 Tax=Nakamurella deserti TaxID=2164074 RepID=UPI0013006951|nr:DUF2771 family protein [Nakamurella deserti]
MTGTTTPAPSRSRRRRGLLAAGTLLAGLALTGCDKPTPTITWYGNGSSTNAGPTVYCELTAEAAPTCTETDGPAARLSLEPGDFVQVNIPSEVAEQPWVLVWNYTDSAETQTSERSPVNTDGHTLSYVIRPADGKQIAQVDLQVLTLVAGDNAEPEYAPLSLWRLQADPA